MSVLTAAVVVGVGYGVYSGVSNSYKAGENMDTANQLAQDNMDLQAKIAGEQLKFQKAEAAKLEKQKDVYRSMQFTNPYANVKNQYADLKNPYENLSMENVMEDLTVNTKQAEFQTQQGAQQRANIMQSMQGAAGGSGIAGLAQAMANQGALAAQKSSASIGAQEAKNKQLAAQEQARLNTLEARGEARSQDLQKDKAETLLGMAQQRKGAADAARQRAKQQMMSGIGSIGASAMAGIKAGKANIAEGKGFWDMGLKQEG